jgi:hypothetical protein
MAAFEPSTSAAPWDIRESGPHDAKHVVLLLPGALCTAAFYTALMSEPRLAGSSGPYEPVPSMTVPFRQCRDPEALHGGMVFLNPRGERRRRTIPP